VHNDVLKEVSVEGHLKTRRYGIPSQQEKKVYIESNNLIGYNIY